MQYVTPCTQNIKSSGQKIINSDSFQAANPGTSPTNTKLLYTGGASGSIIKSLIAFNDDSDKEFNLYWSPDAGTTKYLLIRVTLTTLVTTDLLALIPGLPKDQSNKFVLPATDSNFKLYISVSTSAVSSNKTIYVTCLSEDF